MPGIKHHIHRHVGTHHINTPGKFLIVLAIILTGVFAISYSLKTYPEIFQTEIKIASAQSVGLNDSIAVDFSLPVFSKDYEEKIKIIPEENYILRWEDSNKKLLIIPETFWKSGTDYEIIFPEGRNIMFSKAEEKKIVFSTQEIPKVAKIFPSNGEKNVSIDIEEPIIVDFEKSAQDFFIKFEIEPKSELSFESNAGKTQVRLVSKNGLEYETKYNLKIYAKYVKDPNDNNFQLISASSFETQAAPAISWERDYALRIEQAKKYTRPKIKTGKYIDINLSAQIMSIFEEGKVVDAFLVSSGKRGMDTPKGETQIYNKFPRAYSKAYGLYMPYWMAIAPGGKFGIHELPEWPGGYKEGQSHLGIPVSHGCVRLGVGPAEQVYNWAEIGTSVVIY